MQVSIRHRSLISAVALMQLLMSFLWIPDAMAQTVDADPPVIEFEAAPEGIKGDSQVFTAAVSDNVGVDSVTLHYRFKADGPYETKQMKMLGSSGIYTITLESENGLESSNSIQYYMEAVDKAGNRTLRGFAFDPIERQLVDARFAALDKPSEPVAAGMSTTRKIIYGALGVLLVGALASAGGGSDGSEPTVPVKIIVNEVP